MHFTVVILFLAAASVAIGWRIGAHRLDPPGTRPHALKDRTDAVAQLWIAFLIYFAMALGGQIAIGIAGGSGGDDPESTLYRTGVAMIGAGVGVGIALGIAVAVAGRRRVFGAVGASPLAVVGGLLVVFPAFGVGIIAQFVATRVAAARGEDAPDAVAHDTLSAILDAGPAHPATMLAIFGVVVIAPTVEEFIHRGMVQRAITRLAGDTAKSHYTGIAISSVVFTLMHVSVASLHALPVLFVLSVGLGLAYAKTGRLLVPIVGHIAFNAINIVVALTASLPTEPPA